MFNDEYNSDWDRYLCFDVIEGIDYLTDSFCIKIAYYPNVNDNRHVSNYYAICNSGKRCITELCEYADFHKGVTKIESNFRVRRCTKINTVSEFIILSHR